MTATITAVIQRIETRSVQFNAVRTLLILIGVPFFVIGFIAFGTVRFLNLVASWVWAAVIVGWESAKERRNGPAG